MTNQTLFVEAFFVLFFMFDFSVVLVYGMTFAILILLARCGVSVYGWM